MRPQQNRRMRGRGGGNNNNNNNNGNNGNRKGPNPLTRSYESNGPDVKIRGSAQQIAEKYTTLARDAQTSGDRVMAENYLQHAEHYNRIILTAQAQMPQPQVRDTRDDDDMDDDGEEGFSPAVSGEQPAQQQPQPQQHQRRENRRERDRDNGGVQDNGSGPQPVIEGVPAEVALKQEALGDAGAPEAAADAPAAAEGEAAARKPRRPRRPRAKAGEDAALSNDDQPTAGSDEPVTEAAQ